MSAIPGRLTAGSTGKLPSWANWAVVGFGAALVVVGKAGTDVGTGLLVAGAAIVTGVFLYAWSRTVEGRRKALDRAVTFAIVCAFVLALLPLVSLLYTVVDKGIESLNIDFFTKDARGVIGAGGGAKQAVVGTLIITGCATVISVPVGLMAAIYLNEYGESTGWLRRSLTFFVDVMTGIPSIVAGLFAVALFEIILGPGTRLGIMGSIALSVLMIPIVIRSAEEILKIVPNHLREAAYALGTPKWKVITKVVLPTALAGLVTGVMLAVARIIGETAPLLVTTGVVDSVNTNPFSGRMQNLAVYAFNEYRTPGVPPEAGIAHAWTAALVLILIVMILNLFARFVYRRYGTEIR